MPKISVAEVTVKAAGLPEVKAMFAQAAETIARLRDLLEAWEPRVRCPQCGSRYSDSPCGPTHTAVFALIWPSR